MKGYIKLHRKVVDNKWYKKSQYIHLWVHILLRASHSDQNGNLRRENIL